MANLAGTLLRTTAKSALFDRTFPARDDIAGSTRRSAMKRAQRILDKVKA